ARQCHLPGCSVIWPVLPSPPRRSRGLPSSSWDGASRSFLVSPRRDPMSTKTNLLRRQIRAAVQIHSHLSCNRRFGTIPVLYDHEWQELTKTARRFEIARDKGWQTAADSLL